MPLNTVTHQQIADELGVSRQLVGFALRGGGSMTEQRRQEILEVAERMGYHRYANREARAMASRRYGKRALCGVVALAFDAIFEGQPLPTMPYFAPFFQGIEGEAARRGLDLVLCPLRPERPPRLIVEEQIDGFISLMHSYRIREIFKDQYPLEMPTVFIGDRTSRTISLCNDAQSGIFQATSHLIELGHREIAFVGVEDLHSTRNPHFEGFKEALRKNDLSLRQDLLDCQGALPSIGAGRQALERLLRKSGGTPNFTAVVCYNDLMAMGAVQALQERDFRVPEDLSVTGFDDVSRQYNFAPSLTSVAFGREEMGTRAMQLLCEQVESGKTTCLREQFPVHLVVRDSTQMLSTSTHLRAR